MLTFAPRSHSFGTSRHHFRSVSRWKRAGLRGRRFGLTLVEMLVSLVCVLMLMTAYTQLFSDVGSKVGEARSMIELSTRMRSAAQRLRTDLEAHTCDMRVWQRPESGQGYFEIIEGPLCDKTFASDNIHNNGLTSAAYTGNFDWSTSMQYYPLGDTDDVLMFTSRSKDGPFVGQVNGTTTQSEVAEVVWYLRPTLQVDGKTPADPPTRRRTLSTAVCCW
jgi:type II secretory pathway pseudopilin PulG